MEISEWLLQRSWLGVINKLLILSILSTIQPPEPTFTIRHKSNTTYRFPWVNRPAPHAQAFPVL
jgi:hypothetical protein